MKYAVLSDVHANLEAIDAVLTDIKACDFDRILVLGDLVGYGADPNLVIERIRDIDNLSIIRGNHDKVAVGLEPSHHFNSQARAAIEWTAKILTSENKEFLTALPAGPVIIDSLVEVCHGTPFDEDAYIFDDEVAEKSLTMSRRLLCLFGHTHVPAMYELRNKKVVYENVSQRSHQIKITNNNHSNFIVNFGSVGQPRDGDPWAAWGLVDTETGIVTWKRVSYEVEKAQAKILAAGLPSELSQRLALGH